MVSESVLEQVEHWVGQFSVVGCPDVIFVSVNCFSKICEYLYL